MSEPTGQPTGMCSAYGCILPGSTKARGEQWWCHIHARSECDLQATTDRMRHFAGIWRIWLKTLNLPIWKWDEHKGWIGDAMVRQGHESLVPLTAEQMKRDRDEGRYEWVLRVRAYLDGKCYCTRDESQSLTDELKSQSVPDVQKLSKFAPKHEHFAEEAA